MARENAHFQQHGWGYFAFKRSLRCRLEVGFFLKISKEISKAWRKSLARAKRESLARRRVWRDFSVSP